jgi:hypothetical protein
MKTKDIIVSPDRQPATISKTAANPNGLAREQAQMDVAISEVQEDLLELYKRFTELRDTYARLKMRRDGTASGNAAGVPAALNGQQARSVAEGFAKRGPRR